MNHMAGRERKKGQEGGRKEGREGRKEGWAGWLALDLTLAGWLWFCFWPWLALVGWLCLAGSGSGCG